MIWLLYHADDADGLPRFLVVEMLDGVRKTNPWELLKTSSKICLKNHAVALAKSYCVFSGPENKPRRKVAKSYTMDSEGKTLVFVL